MDEIRIYYESIEQANHFILPRVKTALQKNNIQIEPKLIKLKGNHKYYSKKISPIIFWKDPDILISIVKNGEEVPLVVLEFSNAVFTEDHELQRFDGLVAAAGNSTIYVKISPITKKSESQHGGNIDFDFISSYAAIFKKYKSYFYHFDWPCDEKGTVAVDDQYLSCPKQIKHFDEFLDELFATIKNNGINKEGEKQIRQNLSKSKFFKEWFQLIETFKFPDASKLHSSRTRWVDGTFELKLNRFGHAMDPERGMLAYYGTIMDNVSSKMLFSSSNDAWYKDIPKEKEISKYIKSSGLKNGFDYLFCFLLGAGLYRNNTFSSLVQKYNNSSTKEIELDLTSFLEKNFIDLSKALKTIFQYSNKFYIEDDSGETRVVLKWNKTFEKGYPGNSHKITVIQVRKKLDEDDVTYITIHNILRKNGFKILAASYPGAQADRVILVAPGTGRRQKRKYVDIISYLPEKAVALQENKGPFSAPAIQKDIDEISLYKTDESHREGLKNFQQKFESACVGKPIRIGVGFWSNKKFTADYLQKLDLKELDYFVYITEDISNWKIWKKGNINLFKINEGPVNIPSTFEVS